MTDDLTGETVESRRLLPGAQRFPGARSTVATVRARAEQTLVWQVWERMLESEFVDRSVALAAKAFVSFFPLVIVVAAFMPEDVRKSIVSAVTMRLGMSGQALAEAKQAFAQAPDVRRATGFLGLAFTFFYATSFTTALQRVYLRAWRRPGGGGATKYLRGPAWFVAILAYLALLGGARSVLSGPAGTGVFVVITFVGAVVVWWLTSSVMLRGHVRRRVLWATGVLTGVSMTVYGATATLWMPNVVTSHQDQFGFFGVALALVTWFSGAAICIVVGACAGAVLAEDQGTLGRWVRGRDPSLLTPGAPPSLTAPIRAPRLVDALGLRDDAYGVGPKTPAQSRPMLRETPSRVAAMDKGRVVMGLLFYPRGGSAYVVRYLSPALARAGWSVSLAVGSLGAAGEETHAPTFFDGLDVHFVDSTDAVRAFESGDDAIAAPLPMHPSYEDRADVPDVVFASVPPELAEHLSAVWEAPLRAAGADDAEVFHLHHLTPQLDAVHRHWPHVPLVVHLHGTEMKMIAAIEERVALAASLGETLETMPEAVPDLWRGAEEVDAPQVELLRETRWASWRHGAFWAARMKEQVQWADHLITVSPQNRETAISMFGLDPARVTALPNGVDIERFRPRPPTPGARRDTFRRALVDDPQGWSETGPPGALAYTEADLDRLLGADDDATVLLFVGRFLGFKRVPALVRAFARARDQFTRPGSLVIWGGHPGEWEGEHPATVAEEVGSDGIYFAGWRGHDDLPAGLAACDALVVPSVDDPYPQVPLEAMAVGLPVLACRSGGLLSMVNLDPTRPTGWFVPPDDADALAGAIAGIVNDPPETSARGANALAHARAELSWEGLVPRFEAVYAQGIERHRRRAGSRT